MVAFIRSVNEHTLSRCGKRQQIMWTWCRYLVAQKLTRKSHPKNEMLENRYLLCREFLLLLTSLSHNFILFFYYLNAKCQLSQMCVCNYLCHTSCVNLSIIVLFLKLLLNEEKRIKTDNIFDDGCSIKKSSLEIAKSFPYMHESLIQPLNHFNFYSDTSVNPVS